MPTYIFNCKQCGTEERFLSLKQKEEEIQVCEICGGEMEQLFSPPAIVFKGGGFYKTDNAKMKTPSTSDKK